MSAHDSTVCIQTGQRLVTYSSTFQLMLAKANGF